MLKFIAQRILLTIPTLLGVVTLTFAVMYITPGDPVDVILGDYAQPADREALREALGLNQPPLTRYVHFLKDALALDFGNSFRSGENVRELIFERVPDTFLLAAGALVFALGLALPLGRWAAQHQGKWQDKVAQTYSLIAYAMPSFWIGPILMLLLAVHWRLLPVSGQDGILSLVLPSVVLGLGMSAFTTRLVRNAMLETLHSDYVLFARAKGVSESEIMMRHAWPNARIAVLTVVFLQAGSLMTGAVLTEAVFSWPGLGSLLVDAIHTRDYPLLQGCVLFIALIYILMTLLSDVVNALLDPRIRKSTRGEVM